MILLHKNHIRKRERAKAGLRPPLFKRPLLTSRFVIILYIFFPFPCFFPKALRHWTRYGKQTALYGRYHSNCLLLWFALDFRFLFLFCLLILTTQIPIGIKVAIRLQTSTLSHLIMVLTLFCPSCISLPSERSRVKRSVSRVSSIRLYKEEHDESLGLTVPMPPLYSTHPI